MKNLCILSKGEFFNIKEPYVTLYYMTFEVKLHIMKIMSFLQKIVEIRF